MTPREIIKTFLPGQQHLADSIIERLSEGGYVIVQEPLTKEQAKRMHPSKLEMRWANYTDKGPPDWEEFTFMGHQNYNNPFDERMACLLWVRPKRASQQSTIGEKP